MAKVNLFQCDVCKQEIRPNHWTNAANRMLLKSEGAGIQFSFDYVEVCYACAEKFSVGIMAAWKECWK